MASGLATRPQQASATEDNGMSIRQEHSRELSQTSAEAAQRYEIESTIVIAKKFPRNEQAAFGTLMRSCQRQSFASIVTYRFPRGGKNVEGPSVYLAKEAARIWGNIRFGFDIVADTETSRHIRGWAWDVETNAKSSYDDSLEKLIQRKDPASGKTKWVTPDERDLRELTNKRGAICVRNSLLDLLPSDLIDDAITEAKKNLASNASQNIDEARKSIIKAFGGLGVSVEELERYLTHSLTTATASEVAELRQVWKSISDGISSWNEYAPSEPKPTGPVSADSLTKPATSPIPPAEKLPTNGTVVASPEVAVLANDLIAKIEAAATEVALDTLLEEITASVSMGDMTDTDAHGYKSRIRERRKQVKK